MFVLNVRFGVMEQRAGCISQVRFDEMVTLSFFLIRSQNIEFEFELHRIQSWTVCFLISMLLDRVSACGTLFWNHAKFLKNYKKLCVNVKLSLPSNVPNIL